MILKKYFKCKVNIAKSHENYNIVSIETKFNLMTRKYDLIKLRRYSFKHFLVRKL